MQLESGVLLQDGKYKIERLLGQGGFGITYLAEQVGLNRYVAVKEFFMKEHCNRDTDTSHVSVPSVGSKELVQQYRAKFIKEARTIASLDHNNLIRIYDVFEENDTAYYVMECLEPDDLDGMIPENGLPEEQAVNYIRQVGMALSHVHNHHILHLDIKPSNILFRKNGDVVLIDFGISKRYDGKGGQTSSSPVGVSKGYAPIEQYNQGLQNFSTATDVYSLAATLYKMVSGKTPPEAASVYEDGLPDLPQTLSPCVREAIERGMAPRRKDRLQTVEEFLAVLSPETSESDDDAVARMKASTKKRNMLIGGLSVALLAMIASIVYIIHSQNSRREARISAIVEKYNSLVNAGDSLFSVSEQGNLFKAKEKYHDAAQIEIRFSETEHASNFYRNAVASEAKVLEKLDSLRNVRMNKKNH